jgi:ribosomal protein S18 acetylase RimI-like enzyme
MDIERLQPGRLDEASAVLARAFHDDPAWVWVIPDEQRRARLLPWLFRIGFDVTVADVWTTVGEPVAGAARWLPPGRAAMRVGPALRALVATPLRLGSASGRFFAYGRAVESLRARVAPAPHWYLAGIGVEPALQSQGVGTALLQPGIEGSRRDGVRAVLLTNSERALPFYERSGFRVVAQSETPVGGPQAWAMVRDP